MTESATALMSDISEASQEQTTAMAQVVMDFTQIDKATQKAASASMETSDSSTELVEQSGQLNAAVLRLIRVVQGQDEAARECQDVSWSA